MHDRRASLRISPEVGIPIRVDLNGEDFIDIFYAADISVGGVGLLVPHRFEGCKLDALVDCQIRLPAPIIQSVRAQGRVKHVNGDRFGVAFFNLQEKSERLIENYIDHRLRTETLIGWMAHRIGLDSISSRLL